MSSVRRVLGAVLVAVILPLAPAAADVAGPDDSIERAFGPLVPGAIYSGVFKSETDVDYLAFDVAKAGQTLHFDVANTVRGCRSVDLTGCPLHATLIDRAGLQLGGEESSAGTGPVTEYSPADVIDWTFDAPGRYFVAMDSDGDGPTYALGYRLVPPAPGPDDSAAGTDAGTATGSGSGPGAGSGLGSAAVVRSRPPPIVSLRVTSRHSGPAVRARLRVGRRLRALTVRVERAGARRDAPALAVAHLGAVDAGRRTVSLRLDARARAELARRGRMSLRLRVVAEPAAGATQTLARRVTVRR